MNNIQKLAMEYAEKLVIYEVRSLAYKNVSPDAHDFDVIREACLTARVEKFAARDRLEDAAKEYAQLHHSRN